MTDVPKAAESKTQPDLEYKFKYLLGKLNAESLDAPELAARFSPGQPKADFLVFDRTLIVELKNLEDDPSYKVDDVLEGYLGRPGLPIVFGTVTLEQVLKKMPQQLAEEVRGEIGQQVTQVLERIVETANRQVRSTKQVLGLSEAGSLLVITNQMLEVLNPSLIAYRLAQTLRKKRPKGEPRYPDLQMICAFSAAHSRPHPSGVAHPVICMPGHPSPALERVSEQWNYLLKLWGVMHNAPVHTEIGNTEILKEYSKKRPQ